MFTFNKTFVPNSHIFIEGQDFKHTSDYSKIRSFSVTISIYNSDLILFYILNQSQFLDPFGSNCLSKQKQPYMCISSRCLGRVMLVWVCNCVCVPLCTRRNGAL
jgi:hypothetical protein